MSRRALNGRVLQSRSLPYRTIRRAVLALALVALACGGSVSPSQQQSGSGGASTTTASGGSGPGTADCQSDTDCLMAVRPMDCCGSCPVPISTRLYAEDFCYSATNSARSVPASCKPQSVCTELCGACLTDSTTVAVCVKNTCVGS